MRRLPHPLGDGSIPSASRDDDQTGQVLPDKSTDSDLGPAGPGGGGSASDEPNDAPAETTSASPTYESIWIGRGKTKSIDVHLSSEAKMEGTWKVRAIDWDNRKGKGQTNLVFAFDRTEGANGDVLKLSITAKASGFHAFVLVSTQGKQSTYWPGMVIVP